MSQRGVVVCGYVLGQTLGEGTYGKVKFGRLVKPPGEHKAAAVRNTIAVKILDLGVIKADDIKKEICVHKTLTHHHVIQYIGCKVINQHAFMLLELSEGGEIFDRIEPDKGMEVDVAHFYFRQLIAAVMYMHKQGVAHRDIKPENILLDKYGNLKLTDFGLATIFNFDGTERLLDKRCGTPPYTAPEVVAGEQYHGSLVDLWSCAIVLVAMLSGVLPWDEPSKRSAEYVDWCNRKHSMEPWITLGSKCLGAFALLKKMMRPSRLDRATLADITTDPWFKTETTLSRQARSGVVQTYLPELCSPSNPSIHTLSFAEFAIKARRKRARERMVPAPQKMQRLARCSTQPMPRQHTEDASLPSQGLPCTADDSLTDATAESKPRVNRTTQLMFALPYTETLDRLSDSLDDLGFADQWCLNKGQNTVIVDTTDRRGSRLKFTGRAWNVDSENTLVDFRREKGDGLEFKRVFNRISTQLAEVADAAKPRAPLEQPSETKASPRPEPAAHPRASLG